MEKQSDDRVSDSILASVMAYIALEEAQAPLPTLDHENASNGLQRACSASDDADLEWLLGE